MEFASAPAIREQISHGPIHGVRPQCPICNGSLIETKGMFRCVRCNFSFCAGCDGGEPEVTMDRV